MQNTELQVMQNNWEQSVSQRAHVQKQETNLRPWKIENMFCDWKEWFAVCSSNARVKSSVFSSSPRQARPPFQNLVPFEATIVPTIRPPWKQDLKQLNQQVLDKTNISSNNSPGRATYSFQRFQGFQIHPYLSWVKPTSKQSPPNLQSIP